MRICLSNSIRQISDNAKGARVAKWLLGEIHRNLVEAKTAYDKQDYKEPTLEELFDFLDIQAKREEG